MPLVEADGACRETGTSEAPCRDRAVACLLRAAYAAAERAGNPQAPSYSLLFSDPVAMYREPIRRIPDVPVAVVFFQVGILA